LLPLREALRLAPITPAPKMRLRLSKLLWPRGAATGHDKPNCPRCGASRPQRTMAASPNEAPVTRSN